MTKKELIKPNKLSISVGQDLDLDLINKLLIDLDFEKVDFVYEPGQFAVRGGIIDVFSHHNQYPYRIELFGFKNKYGLSFSWKRLLGIQGIKNSFAHRTGIPTTKEGWYRKIGRTIVRFFFK